MDCLDFGLCGALSVGFNLSALLASVSGEYGDTGRELGLLSFADGGNLSARSKVSLPLGIWLGDSFGEGKGDENLEACFASRDDLFDLEGERKCLSSLFGMCRLRWYSVSLSGAMSSSSLLL